MTEFQLIQEFDGWDELGVPHSDRNGWTRMWSELHEDCQAVEISIIGMPKSSSVYNFFSGKILKARGETIDHIRYQEEETIEGIASSLEQNPNAIGFFNLRYVLSQADHSTIANLKAVPILAEDSGLYVEPASAVFEDRSYGLKSGAFFNVNDEESSWESLRPFLEYAFSERGTSELLSESFWPIPKWRQMVMKTRAQTETGIQMKDIVCDEENNTNTVSIAGSSTVFPISQLCKCSPSRHHKTDTAFIGYAIYSIRCPRKFKLEGGGSSSGAGRVCGNREKGSEVDIGNMSREWKSDEAIDHNQFLYECLKGNPNRSAIQIPVAVDGLTVAVNIDGGASECIQLLGGLTTDQLRWIYSSYDEKDLAKTGWDPSSLSNYDGDPATRLWSEIDARCQNVEIHISGPDNESGTHSYFVEAILLDHGNGEEIARNRRLPFVGSSIDEDLVRFLNEQESGITFFGYSFYYQFRDRLLPVPVQNEGGAFIVPSSKTLGDGSYEPLARNIYMNILNDEATLNIVSSFIKFGLSESELISLTGYVSMSENSIAKSLYRLEQAPYKVGEPIVTNMDSWKVFLISIGAILGVVVVLGIVILRSTNFRRWCRSCACGVNTARNKVLVQRSFRQEQPSN